MFHAVPVYPETWYIGTLRFREYRQYTILARRFADLEVYTVSSCTAGKQQDINGG